jgi:N-acetylglucosamine-6-sulfatase
MASFRQRCAARPWARFRLSAGAFAAAIALSLGGLVPGTPGPQPARAQPVARPNIVLILTDDQRFDTLHVMPAVRRFIADKGMTFRNAIVTNPLCCPSRATILTGRYSHTTGVYTNGEPDGGWEVFQESESSTLATALDAAGYRTALFGKYLNGYTGDGLYRPPGWDRWLAFSSTPAYYGYFMFDGAREIAFGGSATAYSTDVIRRRATGFIRNTPTDTPFFLMAAPYAPHAPSTPARRHDGQLASEPVPLGPAVNEADVSDKPAYIAGRGTGTSRSEIRDLTRRQWESLQAVDELVAGVVDALRDTSRVGQTLLIFTSDNGFLNGEHRWARKQVPYEESIRVPMAVRLPGQIAPGSVSQAIVSNVDLAPTIADFAGATLLADGLTLRPVLTGQTASVRSRVVLEHLQWVTTVPTYCGVRTRWFTFVRYGTGEEELYALQDDPFQLKNAVRSRPAKADQMRSLTRQLCDPRPPGFSW